LELFLQSHPSIKTGYYSQALTVTFTV